jgi:Kef-type K+ transport system membrane component KefB
MRKVLVYSILLMGGLIGSQVMPQSEGAAHATRLAAMIALSFIMVHVGYEFELDKRRPQQYAWDCVIAFSAAALPWLLCAAYFMYAMAPRELWTHADQWRAVLLESVFAAPTSAGVLFSMLAAAGLGATWVFGKARVLAIFDDLGALLLMLPLKALFVGLKWQLGVVILIMGALLWIAWRYLHEVRWPTGWPWVLGYAAAITAASEAIYMLSGVVDPAMPVHLEVLLPAFVLGCILARPAGSDPHRDDSREGHEEGPESPGEQRVSAIVSACFMVLVGLSMPPIGGAAVVPSEPPTAGLLAPGTGQIEMRQVQSDDEGLSTDQDDRLDFEGVAPTVMQAKHAFPGWGVIAAHVLAITLISNLGKMIPAACYRREASGRERLALAIGMFPRGEVGAGVLVIALSYGLGGPTLTVGVLSLALNLLCTGLFIIAVKRLIALPTPATAPQPGPIL